MAEKKNLCAQIPTALHEQVCEAREAAGLTTAQYITNLLTEYYEMKKNGGNEIMANTNTRTMAFQVGEDLFQRIKAHLERETIRTGKKLTQREFVLGLIMDALETAEQQAGTDSPEPEEQAPRAWMSPARAVRSRVGPWRTSPAARINSSSNRAVQADPMGMAWAALAA